MISLLHIEQLPGEAMNFKIKGDPVLVSKMIATAMYNRTDIAATMIAAVIAWADGNNIPRQKLSEMIIFRK
jgi:hypothetical protein